MNRSHPGRTRCRTSWAPILLPECLTHPAPHSAWYWKYQEGEKWEIKAWLCTQKAEHSKATFLGERYFTTFFVAAGSAISFCVALFGLYGPRAGQAPPFPSPWALRILFVFLLCLTGFFAPAAAAREYSGFKSMGKETLSLTLVLEVKSFPHNLCAIIPLWLWTSQNSF